MKFPMVNGESFSGSKHSVSSKPENMNAVVDVSSYGNGFTTASSFPSPSEIDNIMGDTIYLTFNAPQTDEYHRGIFITNSQEDRFSGHLFHASYTWPSKATPTNPHGWSLDQRTVRNICNSATLVLLYRIKTLDPDRLPIPKKLRKITAVLESVPLGKEHREKVLGKLPPGEGNPVLDGYDCIVWIKDALKAFEREGLIDLKGRMVEEVMAEARAFAGPPNAKEMVGKDFGGIRVVNQTLHTRSMEQTTLSPS